MTGPSLSTLIDFSSYGNALLTSVGGVVAAYVGFKGVVIAFKWGMRKISGLISRA